MNYSQAIQNIADTITAQIHNMIKSKSYSDKTFTAKVTEIVNTSKCRVLYCGNTFTISTTIPVEIGNIVRVCAPCNNWKDLFMVENKTAGKTLNDIVVGVNKSINTLGGRTVRDSMKAQGLVREIEIKGSADTYYPVAIIPVSTENYRAIKIGLGKDLNSKSADYVGNHAQGGCSCSYEWLVSLGGWDGNCRFARSIHGHYGYAPVLSHVEMQGGSFQGIVLWLRGGGTTYKISCEDPYELKIIYESTNLIEGSYGQSYPYVVAPRTDIGNAGAIVAGSMHVPGIFTN